MSKGSKRRSNGTFPAGQSGNPNGRPRGTTKLIKQRRENEERAHQLARNALTEVTEALTAAMRQIGYERLVPLIEATTAAVAELVGTGEIGPSDVAVLRAWYEDHCEDPSGEFFTFIGLPARCSWTEYRDFYTLHGAIDHERASKDLGRFPPVAERIAELKREKASAA